MQLQSEGVSVFKWWFFTMSSGCLYIKMVAVVVEATFFLHIEILFFFKSFFPLNTQLKDFKWR